MTQMLTETRERFLRAILDKVPADRVAEVHFFSPIKQGGVESGVAVVAAWPAELQGDGQDDPPEERDPSPAAQDDTPGVSSHDKPTRPIVYTARYRLTLKGPDRGKWETNIHAEADAPLVTVDAVVRGVQRRAGDVDEPTRMEGDDVRAFAEQMAARGLPAA